MSAETFGGRLRNVRQLRGLSQQGLSDLLGGTPTRSVIANWETGRRADMYVSEVVALARALCVAPITLCPELAASRHEQEVALSIHRLRQSLDAAASALCIDQLPTDEMRTR